jgi:hypothetical protein
MRSGSGYANLAPKFAIYASRLVTEPIIPIFLDERGPVSALIES